MNFSDWITERIRYFCKEKEITINQLAIASGITQSTLNSIMHNESKNPTVVTVFKICRGLNITMSEFFEEIEYGEFEEFN